MFIGLFLHKLAFFGKKYRKQAKLLVAQLNSTPFSGTFADNPQSQIGKTAGDELPGRRR